ncbi:Mur ligase family protein [Campylobacter suis]|uniref:Dihydrofolate synthase/folylpolyglutamate synthase n=1 Tax=Campylobacter suis TaxID=2790657 RepID=A0ABM8Q312_9BACT|nr:Mur ligase family protein [Campylobacter suis]CAD7287263.1 Dihydrofolate synthase/folylpolyglutamate synthase [Campylobacter suis]
MKLEKFLEGKPLFYKEIDYTRMPRAWQSIKSKFKPFKVIHVIGTNGKGSTGRFLAQILHANGKTVGHYTSPHIFEFKERFWLNGSIVSDENLELAHQRLLEILPDEFRVKTSYFEYATLLAATLFEGCEYFVCEAGMGGELDATNVFEKKLSLFAPIGLDHIDVLGVDLKAIATTKFKAINANAPAILNDKMDKICSDIGFMIAKNLGVKIDFASQILKNDDRDSIKKYAQIFELPEFLTSNLTLAAAAAKILLSELNITNLGRLDIRGRCEQLAPNLYIDVGHNELGAQAIAQKFDGKKVCLIYNAFADKDFYAVLSTLKNIIKNVKIIDYDGHGRELGGQRLIVALDNLELKFSHFDDMDMDKILQAKDDEIYLVFGSFYLVEAFLRRYNARESL